MELIIIDNINNKLNIQDNIIACIGEFDGLHIAHQKLINETIKLAKASNMLSALITFYPHPDYVLYKREYEGYLNPLEEKKELLKEYGIDYFILVNFNDEVAKLRKEEFIEFVLKEFKGIVVGSDYRFAYKGEGNALYLQDSLKNVLIIDEIKDNGEKIGSDLIRLALSNGDLSRANELLGRYFSYQGIVVEGKRLGRTWGFPTANIKIGKEYFKIKKGVYAVKCFVDEEIYLGIANFGNNPTCNFVDEARLEVHLFDFDKDIYSKKIKVEFIKFVRGEKKFENANELIRQITKDKEEVFSEFGGKI